jgi:hypothetical protein
MGLGIVSVTLFNGLVTINDLYANIRDIRTTKEDGKYRIEFVLHTKKETENIKVDFFHDSRLEPYLEIWADAYDLCKARLTEQGVSWTDIV